MAVEPFGGFGGNSLSRKLLPGATNFVNELLYSNCQIPFYIYVGTVIPAALRAAMMLSLPLWDDIARDRASQLARGPGPRGKGGHSKRGPRGRRAPRGAPDRSYSNSLKHLLALTAPLERIGFGLLVYHAVDNFFTDWQMYLDDADACLGSGFFHPFVKRVDNTIMIPNEELGALILDQTISNPNFWENTDFGVSLPIGRYKVVLAATIRGPLGGPTEYACGIQVTNAVKSGIIRGDATTVETGAVVDLMGQWDVYMPFPSGGGLSWGIAGPSVPIGIDVLKADIYIQRQQSAF